ncbi:MAG: tetratricopeptide repeat-containing sensor histidine kinase [Pedobacter sp.]|uniref:tetratricopeptide repeat-containing sensor histidine kinase n=1 Tax=Pedobacter sp. TaxID=1411316 RepID=UPI0028068BEE|nr:tetratricopeptide repeat-containing sensor histidine kinase [Pedobacter sp.]MDQ8005216.1 tetratricopeptide repeat-containing sensor histidine kinase [Pedobacter sp.]
MPKRYRNIFTVFSYFLICFQIFLFGCKPSKNSLPQFSNEADSIILKANRLQNDGHLNESIHYINSSFDQLKSLNEMDLWSKYNFCANHFINYQPELHQANLYVDSMQMSLKGIERQNPELHVLTVFMYADVLIAQKRYNEAFQNYYDGREFARKYLDSCTYKKFSYHLGIVRYRQGQYRKAIPYVKQSLSKSTKCKDSFSETVTSPQSYLNTLALCYEKLGQLDSAAHYYTQALNLLKNSKPTNKADRDFVNAAKGVVMGNLGGVWGKMQRSDLAAQYLKESILINDRPGYEVVDAITAQLKLIDILINDEKYQEANEYLESSKKRIDWHAAQNRDVDQLRSKWYKLRWQYAERIDDKNGVYSYSKRYIQLKDSLYAINQGMVPADMDNAFKIKEQQHNIALLDRDNQIKKLWLVAASILVAMAAFTVYVIWSNLKRTTENVASLTKLNHRIEVQNEQMQKVLSDLEQSHSDNTELMRIVAHDLRNPLEGIKAIVDLMQTHDKNEEDRQMLTMIHEASKNSLELVADLLHLKSAKEELRKEEIDLDQLLKYCVDLLEHKASEKMQLIQLDSLKINIYGHREKLWRVLSNLITNAIKFSDEGSLIVVGVEQKEEQVQITVKDKGIGIPDDIKAHLFDISANSKRLGTKGEKSYGLGLFISKQIVELHGGQIWFESEIGKGSTFYVSLPIKAN